MSFSHSGRATTAFFRAFRTKAWKSQRVRRRGRLVHPYFFVDLAPIERMSVPSAVVLTAEFHRLSILRNIQLRPKNYGSWSPRVQKLMNNLGALDLLNIRRSKRDRQDRSSRDEIVLMKLKSGARADPESIQELQIWLSEIIRAFSPRPYIFEGLVEAMINTVDHAYTAIEGMEPEFPFPHGRWWATSCYDPANDSFRFFIYDQGFGIPKTIDSKKDWSVAVKPFLNLLRLKKTDAALIQGALEVGKSRTGLDERGKGLAQMFDVVEQAGAGSMRILSGLGDVRFYAGGKVESHNHRSHIGGTLVEWSIPYDTFRERDGHDGEN